MAKSIRKKISNYAIWIILGLTGVGLLSFGTGNFGGGGQAIGTVGEKRISAQDYFTALQADIRSFEAQTQQNISFPEAQALGLQQQTLSRIVTQRALDNEASELGLSVGDAQVSEEILRSGAFVGLNGEFDRVLYADALRRNGMTERSYETQIREDISRSILQIAVVSGIEAPPAFVEAMVDFAAEERSFSWAVLDERDLITPLAAPTDAELAAEYVANPEAYTLPEIKEITYAWLTPNMILDDVEVDEEALRALYEERRTEFVRPERRLVERLIFSGSPQAEAAKARIDAGGSFEEEVAARGLSLIDVDMGDVLPEDIGPAGATVFAASALEVVGPLNTSLGPALFRVNGILAAEVTSFEEARDLLQDELARDRAARIINDQIEFLENELAGGATLEDITAISDMELGQIGWFPGGGDGIAAYAAFQDAAAAVEIADFPEIASLDDGGVFAIRLDSITEPQLQPLEDVVASVTRAWESRATVDALEALAERLSPQIAAGMDMANLGLNATVEEAITRGSFILGAPDGFLDTVFDMQPGDVRTVAGTGTVALVRLDAVTAADLSAPDTAALAQAFAAELSQSYAQDLYAVYAQGILDVTPVNLDQRQINGIHAQIQ